MHTFIKLKYYFDGCKIHCQQQSKINRGGKDEQVGTALKLWFEYVLDQVALLYGPLMHQKTKSFANQIRKDNFFATDCWFHHWEKRIHCF